MYSKNANKYFLERARNSHFKKVILALLFAGICLNNNNVFANECNGVSLDVDYRDCFCITFRANHNGHCSCTVIWDFGDGNTLVDNGCNITKSHCYASPGTYTVTVYVDCSGGDCATSVTVYIPPPNLSSLFTSDTVCEGFCTQFTDQSTGDFTQWTWDFGDGNASTQQNPCHLYANPGTYSAILTVTDTNLCDDYDTVQTVHVNANPIADAGTYAEMCGGGSVIIGGSPTVTGGIPPWTYLWTPSSDLNCFDCANPTATPTTSSSYSVLVTDSNGCIDTSSMILQVHPNPTAIFSVDTPCLGFANNFSDQSLGLNVAWDWNFGDGGSDTLQNPSYTYLTDGSFIATLLVTSDSGCTDTTSRTVIVYPIPNVDFSLANVCLYDSAYYYDNTQINSGNLDLWTWDFDDGNSSTIQNPVHLYDSSGTYNITLIVASDKSCVDTLSKTLIIHPIPVAEFTKQNICQYDTAFLTDMSTISLGNIIAWDWDFGDSTTSSIQNPFNLYSAPGTYIVDLIVTSDSGCLDSINHQITIHPIPVAAFTTADVCVYETAVFTDQSTVLTGNIIGWDWNFGDNSISTLQNPTHKYNTYDTLVIELIVITDSGCVDTTYNGIIIHPQPKIWFVADTTKGCEPLCVQFADSSTIPGSYTIDSWNWDLGDGASSTTQSPSNCYYSVDLWQEGIYSISMIATSSVGCSDTMTHTNMITAWPVPIAEFTEGPNPATILFPYITFENLSQGGWQYYWDMDDGFTYITNSDSNYTHVYSNIDTTTYLVELITENLFGCLDTAYDSVIIKGDYILFVPNAFTPNNDGLNDNFFPQGIGFRDVQDFQFIIYDRWGDMIFKSTDIQKGWDGRANKGNDVAQQDVYIWLILTQDFKGRKHKYVGHVTLLR